jgi:hypothetical protein
MRELRWLAASVLVLVLAGTTAVAIHTLKPATGLLVVLPMAVILYPLNMFARFSRLETKASKGPGGGIEAPEREHWIDRHPLASMTVITIGAAALVLVWGILRT